jgi:SAM-dependent methyltransferase
MSNEQDLYDVVAYPGLSYIDTHPDQLAVMGMLHGLAVAPIDHCRVLEIGCNQGTNLIPMAYAIPNGSFVGFDLALQPILRGQQSIQKLGLNNICLFQADIMDAHETLGTFDYIMAHGVYAWAPEPVRDRLLALCRAHLAPNGVAFISYNALPGGHLRTFFREILQQRTAVVDDPAEGINQGIDFLQFLAEARPEGDPLRAMMEAEALKLRKRGPHIIYHDELAPYQSPVSVSTFVTHAGHHGLKYLGESTLPGPGDICFQPKIAATAKALANGNLLAEEQILDFARMRRYRETLLCHSAATISTDLRLGAFPLLRFSSPAVYSPGQRPGLGVFSLPGGTQMESEHPATIAIMKFLIEAWPASIPFVQLGTFLDQQGIVRDAELYTLLLRLVVSHMIRLRAWPAPVSRHIALRPLASAVTRQAFEDNDHATTHATSLLHTTFRAEDQLLRHLLALLDGTRDQAELLQALRQQHPEMPEETLAKGIEPALRLIHSAGILLDREGSESKDPVDPLPPKPQN